MLLRMGSEDGQEEGRETSQMQNRTQTSADMQSLGRGRHLTSTLVRHGYEYSRSWKVSSVIGIKE